MSACLTWLPIRRSKSWWESTKTNSWTNRLIRKSRGIEIIANLTTKSTSWTPSIRGLSMREAPMPTYPARLSSCLSKMSTCQMFKSKEPKPAKSRRCAQKKSSLLPSNAPSSRQGIAWPIIFRSSSKSKWILVHLSLLRAAPKISAYFWWWLSLHCRLRMKVNSHNTHLRISPSRSYLKRLQPRSLASN